MRKLIFLCLILMGLNAYSGSGKEGHGGHGVVQGNYIYLLDLYLSANYESPYYEFENMETIFRRNLSKKFDHFDTKLIDLLDAKLSQIYNIDAYFAVAIAESIKQFQWYFIDYDLEQVNIENAMADLDQLKVVQIAVRSGKAIYINTQAWKQMNDKNKVALLIHEAVAGIQIPQIINGRLEIDPSHVREVIAYLFQPEMDLNTLRAILEYGFPFTQSYMAIRYSDKILVNPYMQLERTKRPRILNPQIENVTDYCNDEGNRYFLKVYVTKIEFRFSEIVIDGKKSYYLQKRTSLEMIRNRLILSQGEDSCRRKLKQQILLFYQFLDSWW